MKIEFPDHYAANVGGAMVGRAAEVISSLRIVPSYLFQYADLWDKGLKFGYDGTFWEAVVNHEPATKKYLDKCGVL